MPDFETEDQDQDTGTDLEAEVEADESEQGSEDEQVEADADEQAPEETQDAEEEEAEEDNQEEQEDSLKTGKSKGLDWKKVTEKLGSPEVEKAYRHVEKAMSRVSQENKQFRDQLAVLPDLQSKAEQFEFFDHFIRNNPDLRAQMQARLEGRKPDSQPAAREQQVQLPPGVHPDDPLVPLLMQARQDLDLFKQRFQQEDQTRQHQQQQDTFRQGLVEAKDRFKQLVGRDITEQQLRSVAEKMRSLRITNGADLVPGLFIAEIQKATQQKFSPLASKRRIYPKPPTGWPEKVHRKPNPSVKPLMRPGNKSTEPRNNILFLEY